MKTAEEWYKSYTEALSEVLGITVHEGCLITPKSNGKYYALFQEWDSVDEAKAGIKRAMATLNKITIVK